MQAQTGIFAGKGGFDITVGNHTQLDGAVIASTAPAEKNKLDTGTLGFSDIENKAEFKAEHQGGSFSTGGSLLGNVLSNSNNLSLAGANHSGNAEGTTQAAVSDGTIIIRDQANQQQDVNDLSRDTDNANGSIGQIFDREKEQNRLRQAQLIGEIGGQAMDILRTQGDINGLEAALKANPKLKGNAEELRKTDAYKAAMQKYGTGSDVQKAAQAVTAALQGLVGGNMAAAIAGGLSPYAAEQIKAYTKGNDTANVLAHAVWGAIAAEMSGNSAAAGAAGAAGGELAARYLVSQLYPGVKPEDLSEEQKQNIRALATLAAGLAGGVTGDSSANALAGAEAGKSAVDNNFLNPNDFGKGMADYSRSVASYVQYAQDKNLPPEQIQADMAKMVRGDTPEGTDMIRAILENTPVSDTVMALLTAEEAKDYALALLTSIPAERALALVGKTANVITKGQLIKAAEKISTAKPGQQFTAPRDLNEQILWNQVKDNPASGQPLRNMNNDPRFPASAGFQKMQVSQKLSDGQSITLHYQYNSNTGKAYDVKITTPQRITETPSSVLDTIKDKVK